MDAVDVALRLERESEAYYRTLGARSRSKGLAAVCNRLADDEARHQAALAALRESRPARLPPCSLVTDLENLFAKLHTEGEGQLQDLSLVEFYRHAQDLELESRRYYLDEAGEVLDPDARDLFLALADEEEKHAQMVETMIEFVSRPLPGRWLENAEWNHREDY